MILNSLQYHKPESKVTSFIFHRFQGWVFVGVEGWGMFLLIYLIWILDNDIPYWKYPFENHRSETERSWMFPGKPSWGCWVLSQTGTLLGSRIWSLRFSSGADVQTEIPDMAEDDCLTWSESEAPHRFLSKFLMHEVPIRLLQRCFNMIWTWHTRSLMYMLHVSQSRCQHKTCQRCSRRKISLLWFQAVFLHEWNVLFWRQLLYDMADRYAFSLKEAKCIVSVLLSIELQTYGDLWLMKAKRNYFKMMRVGAFSLSRIEWYCHHKLLHISVGWKGFHQDIQKTKRHHQGKQ